VKISIVTINYNNLEGLRKTIPSVLNQTYTNIEYIIIDGGSTDGSVEYLKSFVNRFSYWVSEPDKGIFNAQNKGLRQATGDYILMLNSGDYLADNDVIEKVSRQIKPDSLIIGCDLYNDNGKRRLAKRAADHVSIGFFITRTIYHSSTLIARNVHEQFGYYNESYKIVSDWAFLLLTAGIHQCKYQHIPVMLTVFDTTGISSNKANWKLQDEEREKVYSELLPGAILNEISTLQHYLEDSNINFQTFSKKYLRKRNKYNRLKQVVKLENKIWALFVLIFFPISLNYKKLAFKLWLRRIF